LARSRLFVSTVSISVLVLVLAASYPIHELATAQNSDYDRLFKYEENIKPGDRGTEVRLLQCLLASLGYYRAPLDGIFGVKTKASVIEFQKKVGILQDGIVGPITKKALESQYYRINPPEKHVVKPGETLAVISERYGISIKNLAEINRLKDPDRIYVGQVLLIRASAKKQLTGQTEKESETEKKTVAQAQQFQIMPVPNKRICLTFDDGPDPVTTRAILDVLRRYGVKATFFVIGEKAAKYPDILKQIALEGHVIGVHGYEHKILAGLSQKEIQKDLRKAADIITSISGQKPYLYRPPFGALDEGQVHQAAKLGMMVVMWTNIGGADLGARSAEEVVSRVIDSAGDGSIILLHEGLQATMEALPSIIENLARLGFGFQNPAPKK